MSEQTKQCSKCGEVKPVTEFYVDGTHGDGRATQCRSCRAAYYKKWQKTRQGRAVTKKKSDKRYYKDAEKSRARSIAKTAIYDSKLTRQPCEVCGALKVEAHHKDYSQPLEVTWLCNKHHLEAHGKRQVEAV